MRPSRSSLGRSDRSGPMERATWDELGCAQPRAVNKGRQLDGRQAAQATYSRTSSDSLEVTTENKGVDRETCQVQE